jgi:hypothetical protein
MAAVRDPNGMNPITDIHENMITIDNHASAESHAHAQDIANLVVRIAGSDDRDSIDELARRAGNERPLPGALMLGTVDGRVLAAASMSRHEALSEPTPSGAAAFAIVEYTLANLERRGRMARRAA